MSAADQNSMLAVVQLVVWALQGWIVALAGSVIGLSLVFLRHGPQAECTAPRAVSTLRAVVRALGGGLLLSGVRKHFPNMHAALFLSSAAPNTSPASRWGRHRPWLAAAGLVLLMLLFSGGAHAQESAALNAGLFDEIGNFYVSQSKAMAAILRPLALTLFAALSVISLALFLYRQALSGEGNLPAFISKFTLEIVKVGFFLWLVQNGPEFVMQFLSYFTDAGAKAGQTGPLSASTIVMLGFDSCFRIFDAIGEMGWGDTAAFGLPLALAGLLILACFAAVGVLFLIRMIELHLVVYGGILLLGFSGLSFTRDIPKQYLSYVLSAGTQLFMLYVIVGLGMQLAQSWPATLTTNGDGTNIMHQALYVLVSAATFASLAWSVPKVAGSLVSGQVNLGAADAIAPAAAAGGAAAMGAAVASGGATAVMAATQGAVQASSAGTALAKQQGASGAAAALKGLGHAAGAMTAEAGAAMKAKAGFSPPSVHAQDRRGRAVDNLGTRAANNLNSQVQASRETSADMPSAPAGAGGGGLTIGGASPVPAAASGSTSSPEASGSQYERPSSGADKRAPLRPPQLPPDAAPNSAVSIRLDTAD